jgi:hypothetical protein
MQRSVLRGTVLGELTWEECVAVCRVGEQGILLAQVLLLCFLFPNLDCLCHLLGLTDLATNATNSTTIVQGIRDTYLNWEAGNHRLLCPEPSNKNKIQITNR